MTLTAVTENNNVTQGLNFRSASRVHQTDSTGAVITGGGSTVRFILKLSYFQYG